jgi:hypothetical protein
MGKAERPIELLRDKKGIYGLGIVPDYEFADPENISPEHTRHHHPKRPIILRPDKWEGAEPIIYSSSNAILQRIPYRKRHYKSGDSLETAFRNVMHDEMLRKSGVKSPAVIRNFYQHLIGNDGNWMEELPAHPHCFRKSRDNPEADLYAALVKERDWRVKKVLKRFLAHHHPYLGRCTWTLNRLVMEALEAAADPGAIKAARRYHEPFREVMYREIAGNLRYQQLTDTFPLLALEMFVPGDDETDAHREQRAEAKRLAARGVVLRRVAAAMNVPMSLRGLKPAVTHLSSYLREGFERYLPDTTRGQQLFFRPFISKYYQTNDPAFALWIARNILALGNRIGPVLRELSNIQDWVVECRRETPRCVTRPFSPDMSVRTVRRESDAWHEAISKCKAEASPYKIPPPWYPPGQANGYQIVPLDSVEALYKEGRTMHNCVGSYDRQVAAGNCYLYSVRRDDNRFATVELVRNGASVRTRQIAGPCNAEVPKEITAAVRAWLTGLKKAA